MAYKSVLWSHPCPEPEGLARGEAVATCLGLLRSWHHHPLASSPGRLPDEALTMVHFSLQPHLGAQPLCPHGLHGRTQSSLSVRCVLTRKQSLSLRAVCAISAPARPFGVLAGMSLSQNLLGHLCTWPGSLVSTAAFRSLASRPGFPGGASGKNLPAMQVTQKTEFRSLGEGNGKPTPIFLPEESHRQRGLVGYSPWGCKESGTSEQLSTQMASTL